MSGLTVVNPPSIASVLAVVEGRGFLGRFNNTLGSGMLPEYQLSELVTFLKGHSTVGSALQSAYMGVQRTPTMRPWLVAIGYAVAVASASQRA